ncbi:MAG: thioredoxin-dependent thiol peroxidase [Nitrospirae bacterium]|nr:thioredoxin-dependent thiol peroxidase [Nitrospirota bacterium]
MAVKELKVGDAAPDFRLPSTEGREISLKEFRGKKNVVLYFYPKDDTPGCTKEACSFRDERSKFDKKDAVILGVSFDNLESHKKFAGKYHLPFPLLSDTDKKVAEAYGVYKEKSMYGRTYMGIERSTFVIGKDGKIAQVYRKVKVDGHSDETLEALSKN